MITGAVLCVAAAILSFFIGSFEGTAMVVFTILLLVCTFGGLIFVGLGIRESKKYIGPTL